MLILSRHRDERVVVGDDVVVTVVDIRGDKVRLGFLAPDEVSVHRDEVFDQVRGDVLRNRGGVPTRAMRFLDDLRNGRTRSC